MKNLKKKIQIILIEEKKLEIQTNLQEGVKNQERGREKKYINNPIHNLILHQEKRHKEGVLANFNKKMKVLSMLEKEKLNIKFRNKVQRLNRENRNFRLIKNKRRKHPSKRTKIKVVNKVKKGQKRKRKKFKR